MQKSHLSKLVVSFYVTVAVVRLLLRISNLQATGSISEVRLNYDIHCAQLASNYIEKPYRFDGYAISQIYSAA